MSSFIISAVVHQIFPSTWTSKVHSLLMEICEFLFSWLKTSSAPVDSREEKATTISQTVTSFNTSCFVRLSKSSQNVWTRRLARIRFNLKNLSVTRSIKRDLIFWENIFDSFFQMHGGRYQEILEQVWPWKFNYGGKYESWSSRIKMIRL